MRFRGGCISLRIQEHSSVLSMTLRCKLFPPCDPTVSQGADSCRKTQTLYLLDFMVVLCMCIPEA